MSYTVSNQLIPAPIAPAYQQQQTTPVVVEDWTRNVPTAQGMQLIVPPTQSYVVPPTQSYAVQPAPTRPIVSTRPIEQYITPPPKVQAPPPIHPNPPRQYVCDGFTINDEVGNPVGLIKVFEGNRGTEIVSPQGEPLLRYDKVKRNIKDVQANKIIAVVSDTERAIYHGSGQFWKDRKEPPRIYKYVVDESDGVNMNLWVYAARGGAHIATVTRRSDGYYPSRISIQPNVPYHLLLITLFLI